jgi:hypothetical protein
MTSKTANKFSPEVIARAMRCPTIRSDPKPILTCPRVFEPSIS